MNFQTLREKIDDRLLSRKTLNETINKNCEQCKKESVFIYLGNYGVPWKAAHLYSCVNCGYRINSLEPLR